MEKEKAKETIKALKCCSSLEIYGCRDCPLKGEIFTDCSRKLAARALEYIEELGGLKICEVL